MQSVFYDCHHPCFADEQRRPMEVKHLLQVKGLVSGGMDGKPAKSPSLGSLSLCFWSPGSCLPFTLGAHSALQEGQGPHSGCPWVSLNFHKCFSQKTPSKRLSSPSVQTSLLILLKHVVALNLMPPKLPLRTCMF